MEGTRNQEIEVKFFIKESDQIEDLLILRGGQLIQPKVMEINYRFDTKDYHLQNQDKILRVRNDVSSFLTYKGPAVIKNGVQIREELEVSIDDFQMTLDILQSIGFQIKHIYEKYRTIYAFKDIHVMIDQLPIGSFIEVEGKSPEKIKNFVESININWDRNIQIGYLIIYQKLCELKRKQFQNMLFEDGLSTNSDLEKLGIYPADAHWSSNR